MDADTKEVVLRPSDIYYTQGTIATKFTNGTPIGQLIDDVVSGKCLISDIKRIEVKLVDGFWFSADNRRLWVFKQLEFLGHCPVITAKVVKRVYGNKCTSDVGGLDICLRGGDPGGTWFSKILEIKNKLSKDKRNTAIEKNTVQTGFSKVKLSKNNELECIESSKVPVFQYDSLQAAHGSTHKTKHKMTDTATASLSDIHEKRSKLKCQTSQNKTQNLRNGEHKRQQASGTKIANSSSKGSNITSDNQDSAGTVKLESKFSVTTKTIAVTKCSKQKVKKKQQANKKKANCADARAQGINAAIKGARKSKLDATNTTIRRETGSKNVLRGSHNILQSKSEGKKTATAKEDSICKNIKAKRLSDKNDKPKTNTNLRKAELLQRQPLTSHKQVKCKTADVQNQFPAAMACGITISNAEINHSVCGRDQTGQNSFSEVTDTKVKSKKKRKRRRKKAKPMANSINDDQKEQSENHEDCHVRSMPFPGFQLTSERNDKEKEYSPTPDFLQKSVYDYRPFQSCQNFAYFSGTCGSTMCIDWSDMSDTEYTDGMNIDEDTTSHDDDDDDLLNEINNYSDDELNFSFYGFSSEKPICNTNRQPSCQEDTKNDSSAIPGYFRNAGAEFVSKNSSPVYLSYDGNYITRNVYSDRNNKMEYPADWHIMNSESSVVPLDPYRKSYNNKNSSDKIAFDTECIIGNDAFSTESGFVNRNKYLHGVRVKETISGLPQLEDFNDNFVPKRRFQDSEMFKAGDNLADNDDQNDITFDTTFGRLYSESEACGSPFTNQKQCKKVASLDKSPKHWCTIL